jgi:hypothetical protein
MKMMFFGPLDPDKYLKQIIHSMMFFGPSDPYPHKHTQADIKTKAKTHARKRAHKIRVDMTNGGVYCKSCVPYEEEDTCVS